VWDGGERGIVEFYFETEKRLMGEREDAKHGYLNTLTERGWTS
jgi:hypothetical protein